jgi:hypothetical protein
VLSHGWISSSTGHFLKGLLEADAAASNGISRWYNKEAAHLLEIPCGLPIEGIYAGNGRHASRLPFTEKPSKAEKENPIPRMQKEVSISLKKKKKEKEKDLKKHFFPPP